jgi:hypothetical protein
MADAATIVTVWRATTASENKNDLAENRLVSVQSKKIDDPDVQVIYEMHVPREALEDTDDPDVFNVRWADAQQWPYQVICR